jgi:hypothetical protein
MQWISNFLSFAVANWASICTSLESIWAVKLTANWLTYLALTCWATSVIIDVAMRTIMVTWKKWTFSTGTILTPVQSTLEAVLAVDFTGHWLTLVTLANWTFMVIIFKAM